jgi:hypothetical protein
MKSQSTERAIVPDRKEAGGAAEETGFVTALENCNTGQGPLFPRADIAREIQMHHTNSLAELPRIAVTE